MPSHPDRVRRNYHDVGLNIVSDMATAVQRIEIVVRHDEIATAVSARELKDIVVRKIAFGIERDYR